MSSPIPNDLEAVHRAAAIITKGLGDRQARFVFSTDAIDSYGERVAQNWKLERFKKNPVALFGHNSRDLPIGHAKDVKVEDGKLVGTIVFASAEATRAPSRFGRASNRARSEPSASASTPIR